MTDFDPEIIDRLARIEVKVDGIKDDNSRGDGIHSDHEQRIRRLEKWMYVLTGVAAAIGSASGQVASKLIG